MAASQISTEATSDAHKPKPMSRKVLASAGVAAFVLGNRSRVEILDLRDARRSYVFFSDARTTVPHRRARPHGHARRAGARPPRFHGQGAPRGRGLYKATWAP